MLYKVLFEILVWRTPLRQSAIVFNGSGVRSVGQSRSHSQTRSESQSGTESDRKPEPELWQIRLKSSLEPLRATAQWLRVLLSLGRV